MARNRKRGGRVTPKGTRPRNWSGGGPPVMPQPRDEPEEIRVIREKLREPGPYGLLIHASSMAAVFDPRLLSPFERSGGEDSDSLVPVIEAMAGSGLIEGKALVAALAEVACQEEERAAARAYVREFPLSVWAQFPSWLPDLQRPRPVAAAVQHDRSGDWSYQILEVEVGDESICLMTHCDDNGGHTIADGYPAPVSLAKVKQLSEKHADGLEIVFDDLDIHECAARIRYAIDKHARTIPLTESETWPASRGLFEWLVRVAEPSETCDFDYQDPDPGLEDELVGRFLASSWGRDAAKSGATVNLDSLWWFASGYGHAQPLLWGPERAWQVLTDWFPRKVICPEEEARRFPELLKAWIRFAHRETRVPREVTDRTFEAVADGEPIFVEQIGDPERPKGIGALMGQVAAEMGLVTDADFDHFAAFAAMDLDRIRQAVGEDHVDNIPVEPLPAEEFDYGGFDAVTAAMLESWVDHIALACDELLDEEIRTASYRLLRRIAFADPAIIRRGRSDRGALALLYVICSANEVFFDRISGDEGPSVLVQDLTTFFKAPKSGHTSRADTLLKAIGLARDSYFGQGIFLGDPELLTSHHRLRLVRRQAMHADG